MYLLSFSTNKRPILTRMELDDNKIEILLRKDSINQEIIKQKTIFKRN